MKKDIEKGERRKKKDEGERMSETRAPVDGFRFSEGPR